MIRKGDVKKCLDEHDYSKIKEFCKLFNKRSRIDLVHNEAIIYQGHQYLGKIVKTIYKRTYQLVEDFKVYDPKSKKMYVVPAGTEIFQSDDGNNFTIEYNDMVTEKPTWTMRHSANMRQKVNLFLKFYHDNKPYLFAFSEFLDRYKELSEERKENQLKVDNYVTECAN